MHAKSVTVTLTTASDGTVTGYLDAINGRLFEIIYTKDDYTDGVDFTITMEDTGRGVWTESNVNASTVRAPRQPTHDAIGVASLYAAAGVAVESYIVAADERVKIILAAGGDSKSGTFTVIYG